MGNSDIYAAVARNLRDFGYPDVTSEMIRETHEAMTSGADLPHGIVSMFAKRQLDEANEKGLLHA